MSEDNSGWIMMAIIVGFFLIAGAVIIYNDPSPKRLAAFKAAFLVSVISTPFVFVVIGLIRGVSVENFLSAPILEIIGFIFVIALFRAIAAAAPEIDHNHDLYPPDDEYVTPAERVKANMRKHEQQQERTHNQAGH